LSDYWIKKGYRSNEQPTHYDDSLEDSQIYQLDVYKHAAAIATDRKVESVLDIGCGLGTKLVNYIAPLCPNITGIDSEYAIAACRERHPSGEWLVLDLEAPNLYLDTLFDLVICADVIEHLINPDHLLNLIKASTHPESRVVLSTPERDLRRGPDDFGPPQNLAHVREWNSEEFLDYLGSKGFQVHDHRIVQLKEGMMTCQMVTGNFW